MSAQEIRAFNRFYTNLIGALDYSRQLHTPYTLTEARVLYELAHAVCERTDAADLRAALSVDAGQLSRMLTRFEEQGLVTRKPSERDARRQRVELSGPGREAAELLEERSRDAVGSLLDQVPEKELPRLMGAMRTVREVLQGGPGPAPAEPGPEPGSWSSAPVNVRAPHPGDLGWIIERNAAVYAEEFGWDSTYEALVARIVAEFAAEHDAADEATWVAELDGARAGSVMCVREPGAPETARLRLLLVEPHARGHGLGRRLVDECVDFARGSGYRELVLWTNDVLVSARRIYERAGFELLGEEPHHSFGRELIGQDWRLTL